MGIIKDIINETNASDFVVGRHLGTSSDYIKSVKNKKDDILPKVIFDRAKALLEDLEPIASYYRQQEDFWDNTIGERTLQEFIDDLGVTQEEISNATLISPSDVAEAISEYGLFKDNNTKDILIDFIMWSKNMKEMNENQKMIAPEEPTNICGEDKVPESFPDLPNTIESEPVMNDNVDSKDEQIAGLNRQLDWYEQIIDTFSKLANLAVQNNK